MAVEWTITIEGKNEFGDVCRKAVRIDKRWERLFDGDLGLSIEDGKAQQSPLARSIAAPRNADPPLSGVRMKGVRHRHKLQRGRCTTCICNGGTSG
jgi:hypothetical protein